MTIKQFFSEMVRFYNSVDHQMLRDLIENLRNHFLIFKAQNLSNNKSEQFCMCVQTIIKFVYCFFSTLRQPDSLPKY